jgi:arylsulfatase A-like enzyme
MTGRYPSTIHVNYNGTDYFPKEAEATLISRLLAEVGYDCGLVGKLHLAGCYNRREPRVEDGFRTFFWSHSPVESWPPELDDYRAWLVEMGQDPEEVLRLPHDRLHEPMPPSPDRDNVPAKYHMSRWITDKSIEFIEGAREPWFLCANSFAPHPPFNPPLEYFSRYDIDTLPGPHFVENDIQNQKELEAAGAKFQTKAANLSEEEGRLIQGTYYALVELIDDQFGRLMNYLEESGLRNDTMVLFMSDHGEMLGDHGLIRKGCRFYEGSVHVPLVTSWPDGFSKDIRSPALVELIDIAPTLLNIASQPIPPLMQGRSLLPLLREEMEDEDHRSYVRSEYFDPSSGRKRTHATMYRDARWKLVTYHVEGGSDDVGEIYDLKDDPWEYRNLWNDADSREHRYRLLMQSFDAAMLAMDPGPPKTLRF